MYLHDQRGRLYWLEPSGKLFRWRRRQARAGLGAVGGLSDVWSIVGQLAPTVTAFAFQNYQAAQMRGAQEKEIGRQWETLVRHAVDLFNRIQAQPRITEADAAAATQAVQQLAAVAQQYPIRYITDQWQSAAYRPAFEKRLSEIVAAAARGAAPGPTIAPPLGPGANVTNGSAATGSGIFSNPLILPALIIGTVLFLRK